MRISIEADGTIYVNVTSGQEQTVPQTEVSRAELQGHAERVDEERRDDHLGPGERRERAHPATRPRECTAVPERVPGVRADGLRDDPHGTQRRS